MPQGRRRRPHDTGWRHAPPGCLARLPGHLAAAGVPLGVWGRGALTGPQGYALTAPAVSPLMKGKTLRPGGAAW